MARIKALVRGVWHPAIEETPDLLAEFARHRCRFRHWVTKDGSSEYPAETGRYRLYVSYACPWAHRTILYRKLKGLEDVVAMSVLHPRWGGPEGWTFGDSEMSTIDHAGGRRHLHEIYKAAAPHYSGRVSVPVLWDEATSTIVSNESADIVRMLNSAFDGAGGDPTVDFYPSALRDNIDGLNAILLPKACSGVYRAGFARTQAAYDQAVGELFSTLDTLERRFDDGRPYLLGERITESDWHLFATLCRFDAAYHGALKCNLRRLIDYPALSAYTRRLHETPGVAETVRFDHIKRHYYDAIGDIDPTIVPEGPAVDYATQHRSASSEERFRKEIRDLHKYLEDWLKGKAPDRDRGPVRLDNALAEGFFVIHPSGIRESKAEVVCNFASAYGGKPADYALEITDLSAHLLHDGLCLATYRESHRGEPERPRLSSALLQQRAVGKTIEWLFLQETLIADLQV